MNDIKFLFWSTNWVTDWVADWTADVPPWTADVPPWTADVTPWDIDWAESLPEWRVDNYPHWFGDWVTNWNADNPPLPPVKLILLSESMWMGKTTGDTDKLTSMHKLLQLSNVFEPVLTKKRAKSEPSIKKKKWNLLSFKHDKKSIRDVELKAKAIMKNFDLSFEKKYYSENKKKNKFNFGKLII